MMAMATKKPAPESAAKTGLRCALWALVLKGSVDGGTGMCPPMAAMVVVVVAGRVVTGTVYRGYRKAGGSVRAGASVVVGCVDGGTVLGGTVVAGTVVAGRVVAGRVVAGRVVTDAGGVVVTGLVVGEVWPVVVGAWVTTDVAWGGVVGLDAELPLLLRIRVDAARVSGDGEPIRATVRTAASASPKAASTVMTSQPRTPTSLAVRSDRLATPSQPGGEGGAGTVTMSPGNKRFGSPGLGR
jgi:hypothetical protein